MRDRCRCAAAAAAVGVVAVAVLGAEPEPRVEAFIQPQTAITDAEPIRLVIAVTGSDQPPEFRLPPLTNLQVIGGPSTSTRLRSDFRTTTREASVSYTLLAEEPGPAEIPAIEVRVGSTVHTTQPIRFEVSRAPAGTAARRGAGPGRRDQADVFVRARLGSEEVWAGQPVSLDVELCTATRLGSRLDWRQTPSFSKFWVEDEAVDPEGESYRATIGGRTYVVYPLLRKLLVPSSPGEYDLEPFVLELEVRGAAADDFFGLLSFAQTRTVIRKTEPLRLGVRRLPQSGVPAGFDGAVGAFELGAELDRAQPAVDEAVALKVTVSGSGFLKSARPPDLGAPPGLKVFPPKTTESQSSRRGKMVSRKTWEWVLVPLMPGEVSLPQLRFPYFDPAEGRYRVAETGPLVLAVTPADTPTRVGRGDVRLERRDIAFIKARRGPLREGRPRIHHRPLFTALLVLPIALVPPVVFVGRRQARLRQDRARLRARRARRRARGRLRAAWRRLEQLDTGRFHEEVARALVEYAADRFDRPAAGLTYDTLDELLASRHVEPELRRRFRACLEGCDFARFVPAAARVERRRETLDEAQALIDRVESAT
jgi:hypothetical protein